MADSYVKTLTLNLRTLFDRKSTGQVEEWIDDIKQSVEEIQWIDDNAFKQVANKIKADFNNLEIVKQGLIQGEDLERVRQAYQEQQENLAKIEILKKEIAEIEMFDKDNELLDELKQKLAELQQKTEQLQQSESNDEDGGNDSFFGSFKESFNELIFKDNYINGKLAIVLPHPSPLNIKWFKDHPEFMKKRICEIRNIINKVLEEEK